MQQAYTNFSKLIVGFKTLLEGICSYTLLKKGQNIIYCKTLYKVLVFPTDIVKYRLRLNSMTLHPGGYY